MLESITALHRNHHGEIINFVTTNGRVISYRKALMEVESGLIQGIQAIQDENGNLLLMPEHNESFDHLPDLF